MGVWGIGSVGEDEVVVGVYVDDYGFVFVDFLGEDVLGEAVEDLTVDHSLDGTCTEFGVVAFAGEELDSFGGDFEGHAVVGKHLLDALDLQPDDFFNLSLVKRGEHDDFVDTVEELWAYGLLEHLQYLFLGAFNLLITVFGRESGEVFADYV